MTPYEFQALLKAASKDFHRLNSGTTKEVPTDSKPKAKKNKSMVKRLRTTITEPDIRKPLEQSPQTETLSSAGTARRIRVKFTCWRKRLLDTDNKFGSIKYSLDALRYAGLLKDDRECDIELIVEQIKSTNNKEGTAIDLEYY